MASKNTILKEFIYLDTAFLHSFIAQSNSGLPTLINTEIQEQESRTSTKGTSTDSTHEIAGEVSLGEFDVVFFKSPSAKSQFKYANKQGNNSSISWTQLDAGKEIISKQLHDNALAEFEQYVEQNGLLKIKESSEHAVPGEYIKVSGTFYVVDLSFFQKALNKKIIDRFLLDEIDKQCISALDQIEAENLTRQQKEVKRKETQKRFEKQKNDNKILFELITDVVDYVNTLLPASSYLKIGNFVAPLKPDYLRESSSELGFKYGHSSKLRITLIGKVTRVYDNLISQGIDPSANIYGMMQLLSSAVEQFLIESALLKTGDLIVSPVAIFFEEGGI